MGSEMCIRDRAHIVETAVKAHYSQIEDGLDALTRLGGREIAAIVGAIIYARLKKVPVILDGYVVSAAAACIKTIADNALKHCISGHLSAEPAHGKLLKKMNLNPLLDLKLALGEGTGAALAIGLVRAALACHSGMASFSSANVSGRIA